ncbi:MAG: 2-dehydropantoate 2-reductase [Gammaproteobacteria bacterium]|jgi:2-dehydropantoate 2-reductase
MKICVYGAGAVGAHFAARLANANQDVSVIARGPHLEAMRSSGIVVNGGDEPLVAYVNATDDPESIGLQDLVIVTVKGPALSGIIDGVKKMLGPDTPIVFGLNGIVWWYFYGIDPVGQERRLERLDPGGRWWNEIGPERALGGVVYSANEVVSPGVIQNGSPGRNQLRVGEPNGTDSERVRRINDVLARAGMAADVTDIRATLWEKLLGNIAFAPIACLTGCTIGDILLDKELRQVAEQLMGEAISVAEAFGTKLGVGAKERLDSAKATAHKPSMLQDLERGRPMEIDSIVAVPQELGRMANVPTPHLDQALALLKQRARLAGTY